MTTQLNKQELDGIIDEVLRPKKPEEVNTDHLLPALLLIARVKPEFLSPAGLSRVLASKPGIDVSRMVLAAQKVLDHLTIRERQAKELREEEIVKKTVHLLLNKDQPEHDHRRKVK